MVLMGPLTGSARSTFEKDDPSTERLNVFLDAPWWADEDFIMQEIPLVNYVRDKELAQVHIIITRHGGGSGGTAYQLSFLGARQFSGMINELNYWAPSTNTADANRRGYTNIIKIGLAPYVSRSNMAPYVRVDYTYDPRTVSRETAPVRDPWKNWVFEVYAGGNFSKEEKNSRSSFRYGFYADKVTHEFKIRMRPYFNHDSRTFISGEDTIRRTSHRHGFDGYLVRSISGHWSAGIFSSMQSSTFNNMRFNTELKPAVEYSLFPYEEATKRSISLAYRIGGGYQDYYEMTIFGKESEFLFGHSLEAAARFQQPWGTVRAGVTGSHFFHDFSVNRLAFFGNLNLRVFQGFAISLSTNMDLINDLVAIPLGDLSLEDILLQQSRQSTSYQLSGSIGLSYTFGSEQKGVYNPRL